MLSKTTFIKIAFNTALGVLLIFVWLQFVDVTQIWRTLSQVSFTSLLPVLFFLPQAVVIRSLRLKILLHPIKRVPLLDILCLGGVSLLFNFLVPIRAGEVVKGIYLNNKYGIKIGKSLALIFIDRLIDFLVLLGLAALLLLIVPTSLNNMVVIIVSLIFFIGFVVTYLLAFQPRLAVLLAKYLRELLVWNLPKKHFDKAFSFFLDSFTILRRNYKDLGLMTLLTMVAYGTDSLIWYYIFVSINYTQPLINMYLGQLLSALSYLIPSAPGYVGSAEASGGLILSGVLGIEANAAASMVVIYHLLIAIFILILGVISINFLKIDVKAIFDKVLKRA